MARSSLELISTNDFSSRLSILRSIVIGLPHVSSTFFDVSNDLRWRH